MCTVVWSRWKISKADSRETLVDVEELSLCGVLKEWA